MTSIDLDQKLVVRSNSTAINGEYSISDILSNIQKAIEDMDEVIELNNTSIKSNNPGHLFIMECLHKKEYAIWKVPYTPNNVTEATHTIALIDTLRQECRYVVDTLTGGEIPYKTHFLMVNTWAPYSSKFNTYSKYSWNTCYISEQAMCPLCKETYTKAGLSTHMGSLACMRDQQRLDVRELGFEIADNSLAKAIAKSGIEFKVRPSGMDIWVPRWANDAIKSYYASENSFAGLKLHEYLAAMIKDK